MLHRKRRWYSTPRGTESDTAPLLLCEMVRAIVEVMQDVNVAGSGDCRRQIGSVCEQGNQCSTLACECADST